MSWRGTACFEHQNINEAYRGLKALSDSSTTFSERLGIFTETSFFSKASLLRNISNRSSWQYEQGAISKGDLACLLSEVEGETMFLEQIVQGSGDTGYSGLRLSFGKVQMQFGLLLYRQKLLLQP